MIRFACRCGQALETPDDQAGLTVQCSKCGLLQDVPTLSDLHGIERDGTYKLDTPEAREADRLRKLQRIYYPGTKLPDGTEIDLRGPARESEEIPLAGDEELSERRSVKYDPATGELVQEIKIEQSEARIAPLPPAEAIPHAKRVIEYNVSQQVLEASPHDFGIFTALFQPLNVIVMAIVFGFHLVLIFSIMIVSVIALFVVIPLMTLILIVSHYGLVMEEMSLAERDELPRPLRNVSPYDDFVQPFLNTAASFLVCYWPIAVVLYANFSAAMKNSPLPFPAAGAWLLAIGLIGSVFFPAVFLTICTSGAIANLRPDRVVRLMQTIGWRYPVLVAVWLLTLGTYLYGQVGASIHAVAMTHFGSPPMAVQPYIVYPLLLLGIYLAHALCWFLGSVYRKQNASFPWVGQRHEFKKERVHRPTIHPKLSAAELQAKARAEQRRRTIR